MQESRSRGFDRHALDGLGILRAVVEAGSFVGAGEALGLTQSAVSRAVARIEDRVGVRLFLRTARSISMTDEGLRFYESVAPHLTAIEEATVQASGSKAKVRGRLRVNVDAGTGEYVLTPRLEPFLARYPELSVELVVRDRMGDMVREGFDVAVRFGERESSALKSRLLLRTRVLTVASPGYLAAHGTPRAPRDLEKHRCVLMRNPSTGSHFEWVLAKKKKEISLNVTGAIMVNASGPLMVACASGLGIGQVIEMYARPWLENGQLVRVLDDWSDETYPLYAYHHGAVVSAKVRAFLDFASAACAAHAG